LIGKRSVLVLAVCAAILACAGLLIALGSTSDQADAIAAPVSCDSCTARHQSLSRLLAVRNGDIEGND